MSLLKLLHHLSKPRLMALTPLSPLSAFEVVSSLCRAVASIGALVQATTSVDAFAVDTAAPPVGTWVKAFNTLDPLMS